MPDAGSTRPTRLSQNAGPSSLPFFECRLRRCLGRLLCIFARNNKAERPGGRIWRRTPPHQVPLDVLNTPAPARSHLPKIELGNALAPSILFSQQIIERNFQEVEFGAASTPPTRHSQQAASSLVSSFRKQQATGQPSGSDLLSI